MRIANLARLTVGVACGVLVWGSSAHAEPGWTAVSDWDLGQQTSQTNGHGLLFPEIRLDLTPVHEGLGTAKSATKSGIFTVGSELGNVKSTLGNVRYGVGWELKNVRSSLGSTLGNVKSGLGSELGGLKSGLHLGPVLGHSQSYNQTPQD